MSAAGPPTYETVLAENLSRLANVELANRVTTALAVLDALSEALFEG